MFRSGTWPSSGVYYIKLRRPKHVGLINLLLKFFLKIVSVHQVGFNFNLYKMHGEYNIKKNWDNVCFPLIKRKNLYQICHSPSSIIKFVYCCLHNTISCFQMSAISNDLPPRLSLPPTTIKSCFPAQFDLNFHPILTSIILQSLQS
jgi:hypothetical protein